MNKSDILTLFEYNYWANACVMDAAAGVPPDVYRAQAAGLSHGSLRGSLVHVYAAEVVWRMRCQEGISLAALPSEQEFPTLKLLRESWQAEEAKMRTYLAALHDQDFQGTVRYTNTKGLSYENVLWNLLAHLVNHGTQFRGEAGVALTACGHSPGDMDMLQFFRQRDH